MSTGTITVNFNFDKDYWYISVIRGYNCCDYSDEPEAFKAEGANTPAEAIALAVKDFCSDLNIIENEESEDEDE